MRIMKIMKIIEFDERITKNNGNLRISCENQENHENNRIPYEN